MPFVWNEMMDSLRLRVFDEKVVTKWMTFSDRNEREEFERFGASRVSPTTTLLVNVVFTLRFIYSVVMDLWNIGNLFFTIYPLLIVSVFSGLMFIPCFSLLWYVKKHRSDTEKSSFVVYLLNLIPLLENSMAIGSVLGLGLKTIIRAHNGPCLDNHQTHVWYCDAGYKSRMLMDDCSTFLMLIPIVYTIVLKSIRFEAVLLSWLLSVTCLGVAIGISGATNSLAMYVMYIPLSLIVLFEIQRQDLILYFLVKHQRTLLAENKQMAEDQQTELRHMIANVAHDLKTPLSALTNGFEAIIDIATRGESAKTVEHDQDRLTDVEDGNGTTTSATETKSIDKTIRNLTNVTSFMIMTINRCLDFTKASKGLKLISKLETIELAEILALPISCMKDLQTRISIDLLPLPAEICSHIITDKQWLQENLFCLISNAVKYSTAGSITISVSEITSEHLFIKQCVATSKRNNVNQKDAIFADSISVDGGITHTSITGGTALSGTHSQQPLTAAANATGTDYSYLDRLEQNSISSHTLHRAATDSKIRIKATATAAAPSQPVSVAAKPTFMKRAGTEGRLPLFRAFSKSNKVYAVVDTPTPTAVIPPVSEDKEKRPLLLFEVEDTGIGLSDEVMAGLFSPFKQAQRRAGGTGLGLYSLAKRLEALGGYYGVQRRKDGKEGSLFWFAIPYAPDPTALSSVSSSGDSPRIASRGRVPEASYSKRSVRSSSSSISRDAHDPQGPPPSLTVLLVDDSVPILKMTSMLLKRQKYTVTQAENGAEALKAMAERKAMVDAAGNPLPPFDVVLMDLNMPVMDGLEATTRLRAQEKVDGISAADRQFIVGLSANSDHQTMMEAYESGVDDFMCKPFSLQTFHECYRKHCHING